MSEPRRETIRGVIKCALMVATVLLLQYLLSPQTMQTLEKLRAFTPLTMIDLLVDAGNDCILTPSDNPLESRVPCRVKPMLGDWPKVGHWAVGVPAPLKVFMAVPDVALHLVFTLQIIAAAVSILQIALGFAVTVLIARRFHNWSDVGVMLFVGLGTLLFGALATWVILNLIAIAYDVFAFLPNVQQRFLASVSVVLFAQCRTSAWALKRLFVDRPGDRLTELIERYLL
jgi:hypothetical protein